MRYWSDVRFGEYSGLFDPNGGGQISKHHYFGPTPRARSYFEAFGQDAGSNIFKAVQGVWNAASWWRASLAKQPPRGSINRTHLIHPPIVMDGTLVLAKREGDDFIVTETDHILLRTSQAGPGRESNERHLLVDVVNSRALSKVVSVYNDDHIALAEQIDGLRQARLAFAPGDF
jgi:hypothetical protein